MAKAYRVGTTWSVRPQIDGVRVYLEGFATKSAAEAEAKRLAHERTQLGGAKHQGPHKLSVAQALQLFGKERLPFMKSAVQEANRINRFLRAAALPVLVVRPRLVDAPAPHDPTTPAPTRQPSPPPVGGAVFNVTLARVAPERAIPAGLQRHRSTQAARTGASDKQRARLALKCMADVTRHEMQDFIDALRKDGLSASSIALERAVLRSLFNHTRRCWYWSAPAQNPATLLKMPRVDNARDRVMSEVEQQQLDEALAECRNSLVAPTLALLRETAMRSSEPLERARWGDVDWERKVLQLRDAKAGPRDVPLSPAALEALHALKATGPVHPKGRIVRMTYEALKAAWGRACKRAGITDLTLHDLRHTGATRLALKCGNIFLVQVLTGHKTLSQLTRYVNVKADDVVAVLHANAPGATPRTAAAAAPEHAVGAAAHVEAGGAMTAADAALNVVRVAFGDGRAAA